MSQKVIRNIKIYDYDDSTMLKRINDLSRKDEGVTFLFERSVVDDDFLMFAQNCIDLLAKKGIENYKFSVVTYDEDSKNKDLKLTTRILKTEELERLIWLEDQLPSSAKLVIAEDHNDRLYDYSVADAIQAHEFVNGQVEYIKSLNLSPFERYMMAYDVVANLFYNQDPEEEKWYQKSRTLISGLTQDTFVCVAHAKVFNGLLNGLGIPCQTQSLFVNIGDRGHREDELHVNVMVYLNDPKYMLDGVVFTDACNDSNLLRTIKTKKGEEHYTLGQSTMLLSAVNIDDVCKMKGSFTFDDFNLLKPLYQDKELLLSNRYDDIFDCFDDEYAARYLDFFLKIYPQFYDGIKKFDEINEDLIAKIQDECNPKVYDMMLETFGDIEMATEVERKDKTGLDSSVVLYDSTLPKLYAQAMVLLMTGASEYRVAKYIKESKMLIDLNIEKFDKQYEVEKTVKHNNLIAERYGEKVEGSRPIKLAEYFADYYDFCDDEYSVYIYQMFSRREDIDVLFKTVRACSPLVEEDDYITAYINILKAQGYPLEKIERYVLNKFIETAKTASFWFEPSALNTFNRYSEEKWVEHNAGKGKGKAFVEIEELKSE